MSHGQSEEGAGVLLSSGWSPTGLLILVLQSKLRTTSGFQSGHVVACEKQVQ